MALDIAVLWKVVESETVEAMRHPWSLDRRAVLGRGNQGPPPCLPYHHPINIADPLTSSPPRIYPNRCNPPRYVNTSNYTSIMLYAL